LIIRISFTFLASDQVDFGGDEETVKRDQICSNSTARDPSQLLFSDEIENGSALRRMTVRNSIDMRFCNMTQVLYRTTAYQIRMNIQYVDFPSITEPIFQILSSRNLFSKTCIVIFDRGSLHAPHADDFEELESKACSNERQPVSCASMVSWLSVPDRDPSTRRLMLGERVRVRCRVALQHLFR
jgi:hypothetical protein